MTLLLSALRSPRASMVTTSAGRLFDAWAALLGIAHHSAYEAEAAMRFEDLADRSEQGAFEVSIVDHSGAGESPLHRLDWRPWVAETRRRLAQGHSPSSLAACFHNALAVGSLHIARRAGLETIVLGGGCFQNRLLTERVTDLLGARWFSGSHTSPCASRRRRSGRRPDLGGDVAPCFRMRSERNQPGIIR